MGEVDMVEVDMVVVVGDKVLGMEGVVVEVGVEEDKVVVAGVGVVVVVDMVVDMVVEVVVEEEAVEVEVVVVDMVGDMVEVVEVEGVVGVEEVGMVVGKAGVEVGMVVEEVGVGVDKVAEVVGSTDYLLLLCLFLPSSLLQMRLL